MVAPDSKTRNKITLSPHRIRSSSIPTQLLPQIFLSNVLFALALHAGQEWLLKYDVGIFWVTLRVLAFGGLAVLIKEAFTGELANKKSIEVRASCKGDRKMQLTGLQWSVLGMSSLLLLVQQVSLFTILFRLPSTRYGISQKSGRKIFNLWQGCSIYSFLEHMDQVYPGAYHRS